MIFGSYVLGPLAGAILGCVFGLTSIWKASISAVAYADQVFSPILSGAPLESLILSLGTRIAFGFLAGLIFLCIRRYSLPKLYIVAGVVFANLFHSSIVFLCLDLFFPKTNISFLYGLERLVSPSGLLNYIINVLAILLLDKFIRTDFMAKVVSELKYSNRHIRNKSFYIANISFILILSLIFFGLMYHFYGRADNLLHYYGISLGAEVEYKLVNLGMQLVVTTVSVFIIVEIAIMYPFSRSPVNLI